MQSANIHVYTYTSKGLYSTGLFSLGSCKFLFWFVLIYNIQFLFSSMVCVKRGAVIEADKAIHSQLRLINFSEGSPYETLHAFISKTMAPYFKSYVKESGRADRSVYVSCSGVP